MTPDDVRAMLDAGADLVQLYTGYIYEGPGLVGEICRSLIADGERRGAESAPADENAPHPSGDETDAGSPEQEAEPTPACTGREPGKQA